MIYKLIFSYFSVDYLVYLTVEACTIDEEMRARSGEGTPLELLLTH